MNPDRKAFLDRRIPDLQNEGKPFPPPSPKGLTIGEQMQRVRPNMEGSRYPGRKAREQADREWAERKEESA